ncbi:MAG: fasciclin domain-containing protein, partial [Woeseia sp.]
MKYVKILWVLLMGATLISPASADHHGKMKMDIVETAANAGTFNTLIAAAKAAGLAGALKGDGPLTVFAPTDDAF